jgi:hypothetical protein
LHLHVLERRRDPVAGLLLLLLAVGAADSPAARSALRHHWSHPRWTTPPSSSWRR